MSSSNKAAIGVGLRPPHLGSLLTQKPPLDLVEVHAENWMLEANAAQERLSDIAAHYPLSLHGVGLSLGSYDGLDLDHLRKLKLLVERFNPTFVSEHLSWSQVGGRHSNDLLPMPFHQESIHTLVENIKTTQQYLGRKILVENISTYCTFSDSCFSEWDFVSRVIKESECGLLLDLNNLYVNAVNHGFSYETYLSAMPWEQVEEIHIAGYEQAGDTLIDTHGDYVKEPVWSLLAMVLPFIHDDVPIVIEWDKNLPTFSVLINETNKIQTLLKDHRRAIA